MRDGGESGIRTHEAVLAPTRFPIVLLQPLGHLSAKGIARRPWTGRQGEATRPGAWVASRANVLGRPAGRQGGVPVELRDGLLRALAPPRLRNRPCDPRTEPKVLSHDWAPGWPLPG